MCFGSKSDGGEKRYMTQTPAPVAPSVPETPPPATPTDPSTAPSPTAKTVSHGTGLSIPTAM